VHLNESALGGEGREARGGKRWEKRLLGSVKAPSLLGSESQKTLCGVLAVEKNGIVRNSKGERGNFQSFGGER